MKLHGVHHVSINVHDAAEVGRFYIDVMGLEKLPRPDFGIPGMWLQADGQQIHLIQVEGHEAPKGPHFAFRVDDIEQAISDLRDQGVEVSNAMQIPDVGRQCFLHDPAGNLIELNQPA